MTNVDIQQARATIRNTKNAVVYMWVSAIQRHVRVYKNDALDCLQESEFAHVALTQHGRRIFIDTAL